MTALGVAVVGLGLALRPHARALADLDDRLPVIGAYSRTTERRATAVDLGWPLTDDLDALIVDPQVAIALILTPPSSHWTLAKRFLEAGKHVLVEKPLDVDLDAAAAMVVRADALDRRLGTVLQHRFREASRTLATFLADGTLGRVEFASCEVAWWRDQAYYDESGRGTRARDGGGVLMTQAIHTLDLFRSLVGTPRRVAALARTTGLHRMECEDGVAATFELQSGAPASFTATTAAYPGYPEVIRLVCTRGTATLTGADLVVEWLDGRRTEVAATGGTGAGADPMAFSHAAHRALLADMADAVDEGRAPLASGLEALRTQRLIETLLTAARDHTWREVEVD